MLILLNILIPVLFSLVVFFINRKSLIQKLVLFSTLLSLFISVYAALTFDNSLPYNFYFFQPWINSLGVNLEFGLDGIGFLLVLLVSFVMPLIVLSSFSTHYSGSGNFYGLILLMQAAFYGVFSSLDSLLFYVFWEMALIPAYFICLSWGGDNRIKITLKFFIYTLASSLFMLVAIIFLYTLTPGTHSFGIFELYKLTLTENQQIFVFISFLLAFAVKIPIFPFHTWQPDTYTVAPSPGSMLLSALMAKMGLFGLFRFILPLCPIALENYGHYVVIVAVFGLLYGAVLAIRQKEIKRLIAFSSLSHVGLMAAAILAYNSSSLTGAVVQMFSHGINVFAMFFISDIIYQRTGTLQINLLGGIAKSAPRLAIFFMIVMLANVALPLTNGFIGEFLMLNGLFNYHKIVASVAGLSIVFSAVYFFWLYQKSIFGVPNERTDSFTDMKVSEMIVAIPVIIAIFVVGLYPSILTHFLNNSIVNLFTL